MRSGQEVPFNRLPELNHLTVERMDARIAPAKPEEQPKLRQNIQRIQADLTKVNDNLTVKSLPREVRSNAKEQ
jgi:hypothetical protein